MAQSIPDFYVQEQGSYFNALQENLYAAFTGSLTPKQALDITAIEWERITQRVGRRGQIRQWRGLRQAYPENVRRILT